MFLKKLKMNSILKATFCVHLNDLRSSHILASRPTPKMTKMPHQPPSIEQCLNLTGFFLVKSTLEVLGAAGAIWGSADGEP